MTIKLHLGVIEAKYANNKESVGTGDVATFLEKKYGVLGAFVDTYKQQIAKDISGSIQSQINSIVMGAPPSNPLAQAEQDITANAKHFISSGEAERVLSGMGPTRYPVPTKAAQQRKSSRFKKGKKPGNRPSFIDTGLYEGSLITWSDE